ncbi:MAG: FMN-binding protein [Ruminococcaceae bacterium]|nr:FMN-binding protein [Oscillospiraceae bacterium]
MKKHIKSVISLVVIVAAMSLLLAVTNSITKPIIDANKAAAGNAALQAALPDSTGFEEVKMEGHDLPKTVQKVYRETSGKGFVVELQTSGNYAAFTITCGIADGKIVSANYTETNATYETAKTYYKNFIGKDLAGVDGVDVIAGTTNATTAYKQAMKDALNAVTILSGGTADTRTEEEIFADNLKAALPEADALHRWVALKKDSAVTAFDQVYRAENGAGVVCVLDKTFIGVDNTGKVLTEGVPANLSEKAVSIANEVIQAKLTKVDYTDKNKILQAAYRAADGTYVFYLDAHGYGWYDDNHGYGEQRFEPIEMCVSIAADGTIVDCLTIAHKETGGYGAVAGTKEYYSQYKGKTEANYQEVDAIAGATYTTDGYREAIQVCFDTIKVLEGGAQ